MKTYTDTLGHYVIVQHRFTVTLLHTFGSVWPLTSVREAMNFANRDSGMELSWR